MKKLSSVALIGMLVGASFAANADVLDFNTSAVGVSGNAVPLLSASNPAAPGGFIDEVFTYKGFTFEYSPSATSSHAWIWLTEGSTFAGLGDRYKSPPPGGPGAPGNGFITHGCNFAVCLGTEGATESFGITNTSQFQIQSLDIARFPGDGATINLYTNIGDAAPARMIVLDGSTSTSANYAQTIVNPWATEYFSKLTITGFKAYYGVDNINYTMAPVPEASTYAMMLVGLAAVGAIARRRKVA